MLEIDIITLFPKMFEGPFAESMVAKAERNGLAKISFHNLRDWGLGNYKQVDDHPFGGGAGMLLRIEPVWNCVQSLRKEDSWVIATCAKGRTYKQSDANRLVQKKHLIILAGHYEGFDQRILDHIADEYFSIGNFVLTGGEIPTMAIIDSVVRLIPGVLNNAESKITDSYYDDDITRQYPQYTRPEVFELNGEKLKVPDILLSGHHGKIDEWRTQNKNKESV